MLTFNFFSYSSALGRKYTTALEKVGKAYVEIFKTASHLYFDKNEYVGMGRIASVTHPCVTEEPISLTDFLWNKGLTRACYNDLPPMERCLIYGEWSSTVVHEPTAWGKFLKRRRKGLSKDFGDAHAILIAEMTELNNTVRGLIDNIRNGVIHEEINFWELVEQRDRIADLTSLYYDLCRDLHNEGWDASADSDELIGNDGSVPYSYGWMIDEGLWQVFDFYKADPKKVMLEHCGSFGWYPYAARVDIGRWWLNDWNPKFMEFPELCYLEKNERHYYLGDADSNGHPTILEELDALFEECEDE
jgi:hypothetical protein